MQNINVKYFNKDMTKLNKTDKGDWIDLRCVGGMFIDTFNTINDDFGSPILKREVEKIPVEWEEGNFEGEKVKFFRYGKGDFMLLDLGVAQELPEGHEAYIAPRGSSYKNFTIIQTNSPGVVDEIYKGDNDKWFMPVLAMQDGFIIFNERVCQYRIQRKMEQVKLTPVDKLENEDRGGHGSSGTK